MNKPMEWYRMQVSEMQRRLAQKATTTPEHQFRNLYDLLTWPALLEYAFDQLMTNKGSRTAGIDGMDKRTAIRNKANILSNLRAALKTQTYRHQPVRRIYIPKGDNRQRALGIPTLIDRLVQMMIKAIMEPIFESDFLPCSHGFRPGLSCHTAMAHLHLMTAPRQKKLHWIIEGDISACFDHVQHKTLMRLLKRRIQDRKLLNLIWQMLKAGIMEDALFKKTLEGTPQGGIASPLLANIYLHELDRWFQDNYVGLNYNEKNRRRQRKEGNAFYLRYADDFIVAWNGSKAKAETLKTELSEFLHDELGLELSQAKTHITHVTQGYDFLGFTVRRILARPNGYNQLLIYPSKKSVMKMKRKLKDMTRSNTTLCSVQDKIHALNLLLLGWANYFKHSCASQTFSYIGSYAFKRMEFWLVRKTNQRVRRVYREYYRRHNNILTWVSGSQALLPLGSTVKINRTKFRYRPNPYLGTKGFNEFPDHLDPYPGKRNWQGFDGYGENWSEVREQVRNRDGNRCRICNSDERIEVHHLRKHQPKRKHDTTKLITLCMNCHRKARDPQSNVSRQLSRLSLALESRVR